MLKLIASRVTLVIPQLLIVSALIFLMTYLIPGSAASAILGDARSTPDEIARIERLLGLDKPIWQNFLSWIGGALQGDLGTSYVSGRPVSDALMERLPATLSLVGCGFVVAVVIGVTLGLIAGLRAGRPVDRTVTGVTSFLQALPEFWVGLILILVFVLALGWFPVLGYVPFAQDPARWLYGMVLPSLALGAGASALIARQTRTALSEALASRYVDTLTAAGLSPVRVVMKYALKNAMVPVLAAAGLTIGILFGTSLVMERVFSIPGVGTLLLGSVLNKDIPVMQGGAILLCVIVIIVNLVVDILYGVLNPKARPQ